MIITEIKISKTKIIWWATNLRGASWKVIPDCCVMLSVIIMSVMMIIMMIMSVMIRMSWSNDTRSFSLASVSCKNNTRSVLELEIV